MNSALLKSTKQFWETPPEIFKPLNDEFGFTLDPCAEPSTAKCEKYFTVDDNGLYQSWEGEICFVNPPYGSHLKKWIAKSCLEGRKENTTVVMLIPSRTDTAYFHDIIKPHAKEIRFLRGRIKFLMNGQRKDPAPFGSMVVVFN
ncbi:MAG: DNA N-6-adenine-methyltransferase [Bacteroidota bacterium]